MKKLRTTFSITDIFIASLLFLSTSLAMAQQNVTGVSVSQDNATIGIGDSAQLTATVEPTNATNKNVSWESSNKSVAMVSQGGIVTGVSEGTVVITIITDDGDYTATSAITVNIPSNIPPIISITTPSNGASFSESSNITINAFAGDVDGTVTKVEFYNGTTMIGADSISENGTGTLPKHWHETKGFGTATKGGIAELVYKVTNLNNSGPGSFRDAVSGNNRLVVFEVGGVIDLNNNYIDIGSNVTIAGQTAPYPGITTIKGNIRTNGDNIVVSHITHHLGSEVDYYPDALNVYGSNIVLDHVAVYWGKDETLPIGGSNNVTVYKCIIAEGLQFTGHYDGEHSKGLWLVGNSNMSVIASLGAHNALRNPRIDAGEAFLANYMVYNWGTGWDEIGPKLSSDYELIGCTECFRKVISARADANVTLVGSVALAGHDSEAEYFLDGHNGSAKGYLEDNIIKGREGNDLKMANTEGVFTGGADGPEGAITLLDSPAIWPEGMVPLPADEALYEVLRTVGPQPGNRNAHNARIVRDVADGTGEIIDSEDEVGGYPDYPATYRSIMVPDGAEARQAWLDVLEDAIAVDLSVDPSRLYSMVGTQASDKSGSGPKYSFTWNSVAEGTYEITAVATDSMGDKTTSSPVTIVVGDIAVTGVSISPASVSVKVDSTTQLTATVEPSDATNINVNWSSSNTSVATVSSSGLVTGVTAGFTTITVTTQDGSKTATCTVGVTESINVSARDSNTSSKFANTGMITYPNPVTGQLQVVLGNGFTEDASIQLFDNTGRMVISLKSIGTENSIDMGSISPGLYLIKVSSGGKCMVQHILKK